MSPQGVYPTADVCAIGDQISSTGEGRHITLYAENLEHGSVVDYVTKGYPVWFGEGAVGVAFDTQVAGENPLIAVDTEGIWCQDVYARNDDGNSNVVPGDILYINTTTGLISKIMNVTTQLPFGYALGTITGGNTDRIAVKVHFDPTYQNDMQMRKTIDVADPSALSGAYAAAMKLIVNSDIAQTGGRLCALSVNLEPGSALAVQAIMGAEICTYLAADIAVAGALNGFFIEVQGGLSYASDVRSLYVYLAMNADPTTSGELVRLEHNSGTAAWLDQFISFVGDGQHVWNFGPVDENSAWSKGTAPNGGAVGHVHVMCGSAEMEIPLYAAA